LKSRSFQFSSCHFRGFHFIFSRWDGVFGFHFVNFGGCFVFIKNSRVFKIFFGVRGVGDLLLWILRVLAFWSFGVFNFSSCHFVGL
jgi:hypothetical protein